MEFDMKNKVFFDENDDVVDICRDEVFKAVFTKETPESRTALSGLVSALIGRNVSVSEILANEPPVEGSWDRAIRYDIKCRAENGELVDVEMSLNPDPFEPVRMEYQLAKLITGQNIKGKDKDFNDLKPSYQITILVKKKFFPNESFYHSFEYYDSVRKVSLNGRSRIIALELSKLEHVVGKPAGDMDIQEKWAVYFKYLTDREKRGKINEIIAQEEAIAMASEVLTGFTQEQKEYFWAMDRITAELDRNSRIHEAERIAKEAEQRLEQAEQKAEQAEQKAEQAEQKAEQAKQKEEQAERKAENAEREKSLEIARNALAEGSPPEFVQKITGLPIETITKIQTETQK
jgi:predicted transposase/invertase (TIGR01784 family)